MQRKIPLLCRMRYGIDQFLHNKQRYKGLRLGLVTNDAATAGDLRPVRLALQTAGLDLRRLYSPEHGMGAQAADGAAVPDSTDYLSGLPVSSLYADRPGAHAAALADIDALLFDLPDIGSRFYTYIWTLSQVMEACAEAGKKLIVLDRPNPISGDVSLCEGPMLDESNLSSFIGRWNIPVRHSLTVGELALYWQASRNIRLDLQVVRMAGWRRARFFHELGLPFVPSSPAIVSAETALLYPALCFLEATNLSEGRGTAWPFRVCGSPWIDGAALCAAFNALPGTEGVRARPVVFTPLEGRHAGRACSGIMLHIIDYHSFAPVQTGLRMLALLRKQYPKQFEWADYPTAANPSGKRHFDLLSGQAQVRAALEADPDAFIRDAGRFTETGDWAERVRPFLLYG